MKKYFLSEKKINQLFQKAFFILYSKGYEKAKNYFNRAFACDPYRIGIHYQLAIYFAQNKNEELSLYHLAICYQIDRSYLAIALQNPIIVNYIDVEKIKNVLERSSSLSSMRFESVEPITDPVTLKFKKGNKKNRQIVCDSLPGIIKEYLDIYNSDSLSPIEKEYLYTFEDPYYHKIRNKITLSSSDQYDCTYIDIYLSIKKLSPYLENIRFFMGEEYEEWLDEIYIRNGIFYSYRHPLSSNYSLVELYEKLVKKDPKDQFLKILISDLYINSALGKIRSKEIYDGDVDFYLKQAKRYHSKNAQLNYAWGFLCWQNSEWDLAKKYFLQYIKKIRDYDTIIYLGKLYLWDQEYKKAQLYFSEAIQQRPKYVDAHFYRGLCYEHQHQLKKARNDYQFEIDGMQNYNAQYLVSKGNTLVSHHFNESARPFFNSAIKKAESYKKELRKQEQTSLKAGHSDTSFYINRQKDMDKVISDAFVGLSLIANAWDENLQYCEKAIEKNPESSVALYNKGVLLQKEGKLEEANEYYDRTLQYDEKYIKALNNKSVIAHIQKKYDEFFPLAQRMIEIDPKYANGWLVLGNAYFYSKQYQESLEPYYKFIELEPISDKGYHALCTAYAWLGEHHESIKEGKKAMKINPLSNDVISTIASGYNNLNQYKQAVYYANRSIAINPFYYHPYYIKACVYAKTNKLAEAIQMIKKMLELDPLQLQLIRRETDFENLKENEEFKKIIE